MHRMQVQVQALKDNNARLAALAAASAASSQAHAVAEARRSEAVTALNARVAEERARVAALQEQLAEAREERDFFMAQAAGRSDQQARNPGLHSYVRCAGK